MRIALVILISDASRGGAERYTVDLSRELALRGHDVTLISAARTALDSADAGATALAPAAAGASSTASNPQRSASVRIVALPASGITRLGQYNAFLDRLDEHLASHAYDVVHAMLPVRRCDVYHPHAGIAAEAMRSGHLKYHRWPARVSARVASAMNLKRRRFVAVERQMLTGPRPPVVVCLSHYVQRGLARHYWLDPSHLATLFNAVSLSQFDPSRRPEVRDEVRAALRISADRVVALMIAQDFARKGLAVAIEAMARGVDPRLTLVVVGKEDPSGYQSTARKVGVADRVIFAGPTVDPFSFYRAADLFILPTRHDPCSLVVLEALAMGLPVISTVFNGACEMMENGRHGFVLTDPNDAGQVAAALSALANDALRREMSDACLALRPRLSYEQHLDDLAAIYRRVKPPATPEAACRR